MGGADENSQSRFIPAGAGNTVLNSFVSEGLPVHPRGCGEHAARAMYGFSTSGSSPRVRGTRFAAGLGRAVQRFIPAGAGNTSTPRWWRRSPSVHPRGCGEHAAGAGTLTTGGGSSPRVRGTPVSGGGAPGPGRFIPAGAGNTKEAFYGLVFVAVHPRGCGEHELYERAKTELTGSSPRVRGTQGVSRFGWPLSRFIPAGAGNTLPST